MNSLSLRSRRSSAKIKEKVYHFITFSLLENWFAFPIDTVIKVIPLENVYGQFQNQGMGLTTYQDQDIIVVNLATLLGEKETNLSSSFPYLMIVQLPQMIAGLSLYSPPKVQRVLESNLVPIPDIYLSNQSLNFWQGNMIKLTDHIPILILDSHKLGTYLLFRTNND
jgi:chemotaxis signal transduction protein